MQSIRLVTFDIFGTLLDWQAYVEQAFPGQYEEFLRTSAELQTPASAVFPYRDLLLHVGASVAPRASREVLNFFADGIGFAKEFADSRALQGLSNLAMIGVVSNCDFRHLLDAQRALGTTFDVAVISEDCRSYKPHAEAWDAAYDLVTRKLGFDRRSWLHASAYVDTDLSPAKERGLRTCYLPRPGGAEAATAHALEPDLTAVDLWDLYDQIARINGEPVRYQLTTTARDAATLGAFLHWMRHEHGAEILEVRGCQQFQVVQFSPTEAVCEYLFTSQPALDEYLAGPAQALTATGLGRFASDALAFEPRTGVLAAGCRHRTRLDFSKLKRS